MPAHPAGPLVTRLQSQIRAALATAVAGPVDCALIDFPDHWNTGDSAIWLGELAWLADIGARVRYWADAASYTRGALARALGRDGVIFISGGGNLGDVWQRHQRLREMVIRDFPDRTIVQLPQTIHFRSGEAAARARAAFDAHPRLWLFVRDEGSLAYARAEFRATATLCPDLAFFMGASRRPAPPESDILWLRRADRESSFDEGPADAGDVIVADWPDGGTTPIQRVHRWARPHLTRASGRIAAVDRMVGRSYAWQARQRVELGYRLLGRGRVVITDRLHGHILSLLLGIPHVLCDNSYGKVRRFYDAWTASSPLVEWADSPAEAIAIARSLVDRAHPAGAPS
jgi:pyruvyl transferase EpsO